MSLVVTQQTEDGPRIVSDTRVGFLDARRSSFKTGTLKAIVITREVTICFAGDVSVGLDGVRRFATCLKAGEPLDELLPVLQELTSDGRRSVEFIAASAAASSMLTRVRDGQIERTLHSAWIGDRDGFERFQQERQKLVGELQFKMMNQLPPGTKAMHALGHAMQAVIEDPAIASVDDFCVRVAAKEGEFNYLGQTFIHVGRDITVKSGENLIAKMAQPVEEGGYAVSVVEPSEPGTPALGLNFPRARMGMVYLPLEYDEAQVVQDVSPNDFARVVLDRFGVRMSDPLLRYA
jgi:hypothetical protein